MQGVGNDMGHQISAIITKLPIDMDAAAPFDLPVFIENGFAIIALDPEHVDYWQKQLHIPDTYDEEIVLDCAITHYFAKHLGVSQYAIIETNYSGGTGTQVAVVYHHQQVIMPTTQGGINAALVVLGVQRSTTIDEFDTIRLGKYRNFWGYFEKYRGTSQKEKEHDNT
jgi:hypothetical protein